MTFSTISRLALAASLVCTVGCGVSTTASDSGSSIDASGDAPSATDANLGCGDCALDAAPRDANVGDANTPDAIAPDAIAPDTGRHAPMYHRADDSQCRAAAPAGNCSFGGGGFDCSQDSDCTAGVNGRCNMNNGGAVFCRCTYDVCMRDTDCPAGQACGCHGAAFNTDSNACVPGNCRVDSDCGAGGFCSPTIGGCGSLAGYYCHTANDTCSDDTDCAATGAIRACQYSMTSSRWECIDRLFCA